MRPTAISTLLVLATLVAVGCGDDEEKSPATAGTGGADAGTGGSAGTGGDASVPPPTPPVAVPISAWRVTSVTNAATDPVIGAVSDGTFTLPPIGDYLGLDWSDVTPGQNGELIEANADLIYAVAEVEVPAGHHVFARGDTVASFLVGKSQRQPGDFYASHALRVPVLTRSAKGLVVVRALGRRGAPQVELWSTSAELHVNVQDVTLPDLVQGSTEPRPLGVAVLNLGDTALSDVSASVVEGEDFAASSVAHPHLAGSAVTQLSFELTPKATEKAELVAKLRVSSPSLTHGYDAELKIPVVAPGARHRRTRRSQVDGSTQYYSVLPPKGLPAGEKPGLVLSLHGAGVEAKGQAEAYGPMSWAYLIAPTNRRRFGFDWEEWGRLDAMEAFEHALSTLPVDPLRTHLTGHSMGGHGSWHVGVHFSDRFAVIGPSAGWISFDHYGGQPLPTGVLGRARAASKTLDFKENVANDAVYIVHGSADTNVPVGQAQTMFKELGGIVKDLTYHEEPGQDHWWDLDPNEEGADCVDYAPLISLMQQRQRDPTWLDFRFVSPGPWVSSRRSFVTVRSVSSPMQNFEVTSTANGTTVNVVTKNVRSLTLDAAALAKKGITSVTLDGTPHAVASTPIEVGPTSGKRADLSGPLNQIFQRPFCFVWDDAGSEVYRDYVSLLVSWWSTIGNGHACGLPLSKLTATLEAERNLVFVGTPAPGGLPIDWSPSAITLGQKKLQNAALAFVYPKGERLRAYLVTTAGSEQLLFRYVPFSSRAGMPDFVAFGQTGVIGSGFFDAEWKLDPTLAEGL
ncbi:MAG: prolyl oligopeptidase family serine peptidase [Polyangiaceae bacterium]|nr:prolyl oligopeptidase family serine peptidase [Polyangiaceae bacterium]